MKGGEVMNRTGVSIIVALAVLSPLAVMGGAASAQASDPAKSANAATSTAKEANASDSASKKKTGNAVKPPKLAKETFSYISTAQEVVKAGLVYKAGEDQPYTGYVWETGEDLDLPTDKNPFPGPGESTRLFLYYKDGRSLSGNYLRSKYVPKYSAIWETKKRQGVTTVSIYLLRDNVKTAISNDNFFDLKDECFYLKYRWRTNGSERIELFDPDGTRVLSVVLPEDDSSRLEVLGEDGIFRKFTKNRKTGRLDGPMEAYHPNGKLFYQTFYTDGDPGSIVELNDPSGQKAFRLYFETHSFEERSHTSNLILVEEWDEANHRFVDRDKEHFNLFAKFWKPTEDLIPRAFQKELEESTTILLLQALQSTDLFDQEVNMKDLLEEKLKELSGEAEPPLR